MKRSFKGSQLVHRGRQSWRCLFCKQDYQGKGKHNSFEITIDDDGIGHFGCDVCDDCKAINFEAA